jgi:nucleotide-binding universal stress UspA family protein
VTRTFAQWQVASSEEFLKKVFIPKASSKGAEVKATLLHSNPDGSNNIGAAICAWTETHKPAALLMMKENKSAVARFFVGSVTKYCATHCNVPVVIIPQASA